jgi:phage portal protein BeeE
MANLISRLRGVRDIQTVDQYAAALNQFAYQGIGYGLAGVPAISGVTQTLGGQRTELAPNNFVGLSQYAYQANGVVFACMLVRQLVFSSIRFQWQRLRNGAPSDTFGTQDLSILERPWPGGTTQDLLSRMIQDADLAGNSYWTRIGDELVRLRPDWVDIGVIPRMLRGGQVGWEKAGYVYNEGGRGSGLDPVAFLPSEVAHFSPIPDPLAGYRGMSWLTPVLREIQADQSMTTYQRRFMDNGATPNLVVKHALGASTESIEKFSTMMAEKFGGAMNAGKTLNLYPGADIESVGTDLKGIDFKNVRGGGETRIAAAAGVPPVIVGLSEGLAAATYSNYGQARRRLADGTAHPLWQNLAGSLEHLIGPPDTSSRLWYDADDVPFLREDEKDAADIAAVKASTINTYIIAGYEPDSAVAAVDSGDINLLVHTGLTSVQLAPPGAVPPPPARRTQKLEEDK